MATHLRSQYGARKRIGNLGFQNASPGNTALVTNVVEATPVLTVTFDQPVSLKGCPTSWITTGLTPNQNPVSAVLTAPNVIALTFGGGSIAAATGLTITPNDPAVRTATGGFAAAPTFPIV